MLSQALSACLTLALVLISAGIGCLAARRLWRSRSRNAVLYWLASGFAFTGAMGAAQTGLAGAQIDAGGMVVAWASLPLWFLVRAVTAQGPRAYAPDRPVFASVRRGGAQGGLRGAAPRLTSKA